MLDITAPLVKIEGLHKSYGGVVKVLQGLDIEMKAGDRLVVIGPSGGGKSTLLRVLMGLEQIDGGSVAFGGKPYISANGNGRTVIDTKVRRSSGVVVEDGPPEQVLGTPEEERTREFIERVFHIKH